MIVLPYLAGPSVNRRLLSVVDLAVDVNVNTLQLLRMAPQKKIEYVIFDMDGTPYQFPLI
jgi:hypothetical protein